MRSYPNDYKLKIYSFLISFSLQSNYLDSFRAAVKIIVQVQVKIVTAKINEIGNAGPALLYKSIYSHRYSW